MGEPTEQEQTYIHVSSQSEPWARHRKETAMKHRIVMAIVMMSAVLISVGNAIGKDTPVTMPGDRALDKAAFQRDMRKLWEDHITWTRLYIVSALADLPDKDVTANRLLRNQSDIGNAIKPFYGDAAGDKLTALLRDHILIAADLITGVKAGDTARSNRASARWDANADTIAEFLSGANPKQWSLGEMKSMMREHLSATTAEVVARLTKDWEGDIRAYDKVHNQILGMADMLSSGMINQFRTKFK
jgi:hypothetical protein